MAEAGGGGADSGLCRPPPRFDFLSHHLALSSQPACPPWHRSHTSPLMGGQSPLVPVECTQLTWPRVQAQSVWVASFCACLYVFQKALAYTDGPKAWLKGYWALPIILFLECIAPRIFLNLLAPEVSGRCMNGKLDTLVEDNLWPSGVPWDPMTLAWLKKKKKKVI